KPRPAPVRASSSFRSANEPTVITRRIQELSCAFMRAFFLPGADCSIQPAAPGTSLYAFAPPPQDFRAENTPIDRVRAFRTGWNDGGSSAMLNYVMSSKRYVS